MKNQVQPENHLSYLPPQVCARIRHRQQDRLEPAQEVLVFNCGMVHYAEAQDGRGDWKALLKNYEGFITMKLWKSEARVLVKGNIYTGETAANGLDDFI